MVSGAGRGEGGHLAPVDVNATKAFISCAGLNVLTKTRSFQLVSRACWYNFNCMVANCKDDVAKLSHRCVSMICSCRSTAGISAVKCLLVLILQWSTANACELVTL